MTREVHGVVRVTLKRPEARNALNGEMLDAIAETFGSLSADNSVRVVVIDHAGAAFCSGADLNWLESMGDNVEAESARMQRVLLAIDSCEKLVVGAVDGPAFAGGLGVVSGCDVVVATRRATFCLTEVRLGMAPAITSALLLRRIGSGYLHYLGTTAKVIDGERGYEMGIVHVLAEDGAAMAAEIETICTQARATEPDAHRFVQKPDRRFCERSGRPSCARAGGLHYRPPRLEGCGRPASAAEPEKASLGLRLAQLM